MSDSPVMWAPWFATVDKGLLNEPVVAFAPDFIYSLSLWEQRHGHKFPEATWRLSGGHSDVKDCLVTYRGGGEHRIWRLNGDMDERGGYIAVWPD